MSFNIQNEPLKIFSLWMIDVNGVVCGLMKLVKDAHLSAGGGGSGENGRTELLFVDCLRAGESEEDATRLNLLERLCIEADIALQGIAKRILMLGKSRRVEDYEVVGCGDSIKELEGVLGEGLVARVAGEIQFHVSIDKIHGFG